MILSCTVTHTAQFDLSSAIQEFNEHYEDSRWCMSFDRLLQNIVDDYFWSTDELYSGDPTEDPLYDVAVDMLKKNVSIQLSMFDDYEE